jgi:hypothetical protein
MVVDPVYVLWNFQLVHLVMKFLDRYGDTTVWCLIFIIYAKSSIVVCVTRLLFNFQVHYMW